MAKMGGPFVPLPKEVIAIFKPETLACLTCYVHMLNEFYVEEVTDTEGIWVAGRIHATVNGIGVKVSNSRGYFRKEIWPRWQEIGIAEIRDGGVYLLKIYKKGDAYLQPLRLRQEMDAIKARQSEMKMHSLEMEEKSSEMEKTIQNLVGILSKGRNVITTPTITERPDLGYSEAGSGLSVIVPLSLLGSRSKKISLSEANKLISRFYRKLGKKRIPRAVRERSNLIFQELIQDGYKPGEIAYALEWIPDNSKEPVQHFAIVPHMIDQAVDAGKKELEIQEAKKRLEEERVKVEENRLSEQQEREALQAYKDQLSAEAREELRNNALLEIRGMQGMKPDFISDILIETVENQMIRKLELI